MDPSLTAIYKPRRPQDTPLYRLVQEHLEAFLADSRDVAQLLVLCAAYGLPLTQHALRRAAIEHHVPIISTLSAARAAVEGIRRLRDNVLTVRPLQA